VNKVDQREGKMERKKVKRKGTERMEANTLPRNTFLVTPLNTVQSSQCDIFPLDQLYLLCL